MRFLDLAQHQKKKTYCHINNITLASNNELSETEIENRTCYYFDKITNIKDFVFHTAVGNVVIDINSIFILNI